MACEGKIFGVCVKGSDWVLPRTGLKVPGTLASVLGLSRLGPREGIFRGVCIFIHAIVLACVYFFRIFALANIEKYNIQRYETAIQT